MNDLVSVKQLHDLPPSCLLALTTENETRGFAFVRRLVDQWAGGTNRFDRPGEALFGALGGNRVVGVCGLNVDPYAPSGRIGRVRHLYVANEFRRLGVGSRLVAAVVAEAPRRSFDRLRLRTDTEAAAKFYEAIGFRPCVEESASTHILELTD